MPARMSPLEQLMPFPTAADMLAAKPIKGVIAAMRLMADRQIGFLVVIANGAMEGVVSERDCARKVLLRELPAAAAAVSTIMTTAVHSIAPIPGVLVNEAVTVTALAGITIIKTLAVAVAIVMYSVTGIY